MDFIRELWTIRCGYIKAESILTAEQILRQRAKKLYDENVKLRDQIPIIDRHLLDKKNTYFMTSSIDTIEIWERKVKDALKQIDTVPTNQPSIAAGINSMRRDYVIFEDDMGEDTDRRKRKARFCSNSDHTWHKRLKMNYGFRRKGKTEKKKWKVRQKFNQLKKRLRRYSSRGQSRKRRLCITLDNFNIVNSERS